MNKILRLNCIFIVVFIALISTTKAFSQNNSTVSSDEIYQQILSKIGKGEQALNDAKKELAVMLKQMDAATLSTDNAHHELSDESGELTKLDARIRNTQKQLARTRNQLSRVSGLLADRQSTIPNLRLKEQQLIAQRVDKEETLNALEAELSNTSETLVQLTAKMEAEGLTMLELDEEIVRLNAEIQEVDSAIETAESRQRQLTVQTTQQTQAQEKIETNILTIKKTLDEKNQQLAEAKTRLTTALSALEQAKPATEVKSEIELEQEYQNKLEALEALNSELKKVGDQAARAERLALAKQEEVNAANRTLSELENKLQNANTAVLDTKGTLGDEQQQLSQLTRALQNSDAELATLNKKINHTNTELQKLTAQLAEAERNENQRSAEHMTLQNALATNQSEIDDLAEQLIQKQLLIKEKTDRLAKLQSEIARIETENLSLTSALESDFPEKNQSQELNEAEIKLQNLTSQIDKKQAQLQEATLETERTLIALKKQREAAEQLEQDNFSQWEESGWEDLRIEQLEADLRKIQRKRADAENKLSKAENEFNKQKEVETRLKEAHAKQLERKAELQRAIDSAKITIKEANLRAQELDTARKLLVKENAVTKKLIKNTKKQLARLE